jgi:hypothetical protein
MSLSLKEFEKPWIVAKKRSSRPVRVAPNAEAKKTPGRVGRLRAVIRSIQAALLPPVQPRRLGVGRWASPG